MTCLFNTSSSPLPLGLTPHFTESTALAAAFAQLAVSAADNAELAASRARLLCVVDRVLATPPHVLHLQPDLARVLPTPKELVPERPLLFTMQTRCVIDELKTWVDKYVGAGRHLPSSKDSILILAGPSGIGKSYITYLTALHLFARGTPLLYVPDAGDTVKPWVENGQLTHNAPTCSLRILLALFDSFVVLNADLLTTVDVAHERTVLIARGIEGWKLFMAWLDKLRAVVILDEHGHAFNQLGADRCGALFPLLLPLSYDIGYRGIRAVFAGSNQANFETTLNGTFTPCLRFVTPFTRDEAALFLLEHEIPHTLEVHQHHANLVPREMIHLGKHASATTYTQERTVQMTSRLSVVHNSLDDRVTKLLYTMLDGLFRASSMSAGTELISFLDLGFVYRARCNGTLHAFALCLPAWQALLGLWSAMSPAATVTLEAAKLDGNRFEDFVWCQLLQHGFGAGLDLPCFHLGEPRVHEPLTVKLDQYLAGSVTTRKIDEIIAEVNALKQRAQKERVNILYKCPEFTDTFDFCFLLADQRVIAVQTSISSLIEHDKPKPEVLARLGASLYVFLTAKPDSHNKIAKGQGVSKVWAAIGVEKLRIVDVHEWLSPQSGAHGAEASCVGGGSPVDDGTGV